MSRIRHDSAEAERLALFWHRLGFALNAGSVFVSVMGCIWHLIAVDQHKKAIRGGTR